MGSLIRTLIVFTMRVRIRLPMSVQTWSFLKKYKHESALKTKNRLLHFETKADAHPGVVVGIIDRLSFHK